MLQWMNRYLVDIYMCTFTYNIYIYVHVLIANRIVFIIYKRNSIRYDNMTIAREFYHKRKKLDRERPTTT